MKTARKHPYEVLVDDLDFESNERWGTEKFLDGVAVEKRMDDIIITAANYASAPGGPLAGSQHFTCMLADDFEEPKHHIEEKK